MITNNDRLELLVLNKSGEVYTKYVDIPSVVAFLNRVGMRIRNYAVVAHVGKRSIFINDITTEKELTKELYDFSLQRTVN